LIVVIGGHSRNIGKTSAVAGVIRALPEFEWTAIKITQFGHGVCSSDGEVCECATDAQHPFVLTRETSAGSGTDTARFLEAGARESWWLRTRAGELGFGMPPLRRLLAACSHVILESNSVLQFLKPDIYAVVLDPSVQDFKGSALLYLDRADIFLTPAAGSPGWEGVAPRLLRSRPVANTIEQLVEFVSDRLKVPGETRR